MWFQKKKSPPPKPQRANPVATSPAGAASPVRPEPASSLTVQQLERRLKKLEEEISHLVAKHPQIHIDTLHVHQPVLENLTFRLDHLDIKELSGSLNLGNNFGAKPNEKKGPLDEAYKRAQVSKEPSTAFRSSSSEAPPASTESGSSSSSGSSNDGAAPSPERTTTGYKYTPQSKTK